MLDLRQRLIAAIGGTVLLLLLVVGWYLFAVKKIAVPGTTRDVQPSPATANVPSGTNEPSLTAPAVLPPTEPQDTPVEVSIKQAVRFFVERFGSYSNQNPEGRIADVLPVVTPVMAGWLKTQDVVMGSVYQGVTTKVITSSIANNGNGKATVTIGTQMEQTTGKDTAVSYRTGRVELVQQGTEWKIDGLYWDK